MSTINQIMLLYYKLQTWEEKKGNRNEGEKGEEWREDILRVQSYTHGDVKLHALVFLTVTHMDTDIHWFEFFCNVQ